MAELNRAPLLIAAKCW